MKKGIRFGMTWGWIINDRIFILGGTIPLSIKKHLASHIVKTRTNLKRTESDWHSYFSVVNKLFYIFRNVIQQWKLHSLNYL